MGLPGIACAQDELTTTGVRETAALFGLEDARIGFCIADAVTSEILLDNGGSMPLKPASCMKLLTTAAALHLLGAGYQFTTELRHTGSIGKGGVLDGDLVVVGGGDPSISARFQEDKRDVTAVFRSWADELTSLGIRHITGAIAADDRFFDREFVHPSWDPEDRGEWFQAEISGLAFNDNLLDITWRASDRLPGELASMSLNPVTHYARIQNRVRVAAIGRPSNRFYKRDTDSNDILATGTITVDSVREDSASIHNGPLYFATVLRDVLTSSGIRVRGKPRLVRETEETRGRLVLTHKSPPLHELVRVTNLTSQNFYADCLLKTLGREKAGHGSFEAGARVAADFWRGKLPECIGQVIADGSGLSPQNRISAGQIVGVLRFMDHEPMRSQWRGSLPQGGVRGSLKYRFQQTDESRELAHRIFGKTGLITGARSLAGIVTNASGHELYYCILVNDYSASEEQALGFIDAMILSVARSN